MPIENLPNAMAYLYNTPYYRILQDSGKTHAVFYTREEFFNLLFERVIASNRNPEIIKKCEVAINHWWKEPKKAEMLEHFQKSLLIMNEYPREVLDYAAIKAGNIVPLAENKSAQKMLEKIKAMKEYGEKQHRREAFRKYEAVKKTSPSDLMSALDWNDIQREYERAIYQPSALFRREADGTVTSVEPTQFAANDPQPELSQSTTQRLIDAQNLAVRVDQATQRLVIDDPSLDI